MFEPSQTRQGYSKLPLIVNRSCHRPQGQYITTAQCLHGSSNKRQILIERSPHSSEITELLQTFVAEIEKNGRLHVYGDYISFVAGKSNEQETAQGTAKMEANKTTEILTSTKDPIFTLKGSFK